VLVVSEICAIRYHAGEVGGRSEGSETWAVGGSSPLPPWVYRKARRGQSLDLSNMVPLESGTESGASPRATPLFGAVESDSVSPNASSSPYPIPHHRQPTKPYLSPT
jgi:hypothetical protein